MPVGDENADPSNVRSAIVLKAHAASSSSQSNFHAPLGLRLSGPASRVQVYSDVSAAPAQRIQINSRPERDQENINVYQRPSENPPAQSQSVTLPSAPGGPVTHAGRVLTLQPRTVLGNLSLNVVKPEQQPQRTALLRLDQHVQPAAANSARILPPRAPSLLLAARRTNTSIGATSSLLASTLSGGQPTAPIPSLLPPPIPSTLQLSLPVHISEPIQPQQQQQQPQQRDEDACTDDDITVDVGEPDDAMDLCSTPVSEMDAAVAPAPAGSVEVAPLIASPSNDHLWSSEYAPDILCTWFDSELSHLPRSDYMTVQPDLNGKMREILVDWLHEVVLRFRLQSETLYLAVNLLDRFLSLRAVHRRKLQLVGCVSLLIAAKYEEIWIPEIKEFLIISDNAYTREHILHMEQTMLSTLEFSLTVVSPLAFMSRFLHHPTVGWMDPATCSPEDNCARHLCHFLLELTLQYVDFLQFKPSTIAAAVLYMVRAHCHAVIQAQQAQAGMAIDPASSSFQWCAALEAETRHSALDLSPCAQLLWGHWSALQMAGAAALLASKSGDLNPAPVGGNKCLAVYRKYTKEKYGMVSQIRVQRPPTPTISPIEVPALSGCSTPMASEV